MKTISGIIETVGLVADELITSKEEIMKADLEQRRLEVSVQEGQMKVNETEAQSKFVFVAGWRPAVGWICAFSLAYAAVFYPLMVFIAKVNGFTEELPSLDTTITMQVLFGMLGLGAYRTTEKIKGVSTSSIKKRTTPKKKKWYQFFKKE